MYKIIRKNERLTRKISQEHTTDNYLTKDTTENVSFAITKLDGKINPEFCNRERVYYFLKGNADFIIDEEKVHLTTGDVIYLPKNVTYSIEGNFEAVVVNVPAYGVNK